MIKILEIIPGPDDATSFYRGKLPNLRLSKSYNDISFIPFEQNQYSVSWSYLLQFDVVFLQRPSSVAHLNIIMMCKNLGIPVWVDYDDNLLNLNPENKAFPAYDHPKVKFNVKKILELADTVTVSTGFLKEDYSTFNKNITVVPNALDLDLMKDASKPGRHNFITWRGGQAHVKDLFEYGEEIVRLANSHTEWQLNFIGHNPFHIAEKTKHVFYAWRNNILSYLDCLSALNSKIMIVPLCDNKFNRSKSNIAWLEGTYAGSAVLAPDWEEWRHPGVINYSDKKDFENKLEAMVSGQIDVKKCVELSWGHIKRNLSLFETNKLRNSVIRRLLKQEYHQHPPEGCRI